MTLRRFLLCSSLAALVAPAAVTGDAALAARPAPAAERFPCRVATVHPARSAGRTAHAERRALHRSRQEARLAPRVRRIVLHVLGGPAYDRPERRFRFFDPPQTQARWKPRFGAHWIVWTDGSLWPRHPPVDGPRWWTPDTARPAGEPDRRRVAAEAAPVYGHLHNGNSDSVGIELAHSGRAGDPFPAPQVRSLAWLLRTLLELSGGRLTTADVYGHKDLDRRPAYVRAECQRPGCPCFVDEQGRPLRRRVDPPESLFAALAREGLAIPRPPDGDADLRRAQAIAPGERPAVGASAAQR